MSSVRFKEPAPFDEAEGMDGEFDGADSDGDFAAWVLSDTKKDCDSDDADSDSEEADDILGDLPTGLDNSMLVIFLVDVSRSMDRCDVVGSSSRRIDVVTDVLGKFISHQHSTGAVKDRYTLVTFNTKAHVVFNDESGNQAMTELSQTTFTPLSGTDYQVALQSLTDLVVTGRRTRVVWISDGIPDSPTQKFFPTLQQMMKSFPCLDINTVGIGQCNFLILQQIAQIGRGVFNNTALDVQKLVNTFSTVSRTMTQTRDAPSGDVRPTRSVTFQSAKLAKERDYLPSLKPRHASRSKYVLSRTDQLEMREHDQTTYRMPDKPFMQGGMRLVYLLRDSEMTWLPMVAKFSKFSKDDDSWNYVEPFVRNTAATRKYGNLVHDAVWSAYDPYGWKREPKRLIRVAQCFVYQSARSCFVGEPFLKGSESGFIKWVNNRGQILHPQNSPCHVGEYTHLFSVAAAKLVRSWPMSAVIPAELPWWSTELRWPTQSPMLQELVESKQALERHGVRVLQGVDATDLSLNLHGLGGAVWVMAFPHRAAESSHSIPMRERMQVLVTGFVKSVAKYLDASIGTISVIFLAMQHLAWKLPPDIETVQGHFLREVFWLELNDFLQHGYSPRYGDERDILRKATYHKLDEVVVARWRQRRGVDDAPGGMTDQRVRSESASRRSSRSTSRGRR